MRKARNKNRKPRTQQTNPTAKRRKTGEETFTVVCAGWETRMEDQEQESSQNRTEKRKTETKM